jgi:hypothetical protein
LASQTTFLRGISSFTRPTGNSERAHFRAREGMSQVISRADPSHAGNQKRDGNNQAMGAR